MNNEDLLTTNGIDNNVGFAQYTQALNNANGIFDRDKPDFFKEEQPQVNFSNISDTSIGYDQFKSLEASSTKKRKKIVRNVINIDSKNRKKTYTFNETKVVLEQEKSYNYVFERESPTFFIICQNTSINDINDFREIILTSVSDEITIGIGVSKSLFEFNKNTGQPILYVKNFLFNTKSINSPGYKDPFDNSNKLNYYNTSTQKYEFNILEVFLPNKINPNEVNDYRVKNAMISGFISNVNISYTSPSHYKVALNRTYSNVYAVRLVSSEIPNTAYSFNGIEITTNLGKNKLSTKINNRLRWINLNDKYTFCSYDINEYQLYAQTNPIYDENINLNRIQIEQNAILKQSFNINIHPLEITAYAYEPLNLYKCNTVLNTDNGYFTYNADTDGSIYYLNNYVDYLKDTLLFILDKTDNSISSQVINTYYIDNNQSIDGLLINIDDTSKNKYENKELYLNDNEYVIISQQLDQSTNNLYLTDTHQLSAFYIINQGSNYPNTNGDINANYKPRFFKYNYTNRIYEFYDTAENKDGNNISIEDNLTLVKDSSGTGFKITNILLKQNLYFREDMSSSNQYYKKYYYGNRGTIYNTSYIDNTLPESQKTDKVFYKINSYDYTKNGNTYTVVNSNGIIQTTYIKTLLDSNVLTDTDINNIFKYATNTFGGTNSYNYYQDTLTSPNVQVDDIFENPNRIPIVFDSNNYYLNTNVSTNGFNFDTLKQRILNNIHPDYKSTVNSIIYDNSKSQFENMKNLYEFLDRITVTLSSINSANIYSGAFIDSINNGSYSNDFNDHIKIKNIDYISSSYRLLHTIGDICTIEIKYKISDDITIKFIIDIYVQDELLKYDLPTDQIFKCKVCLGSKFNSIINTNNEISRVKTDNSSFYKFAYIEDEYNYIYRVLYGKKGNNRYYEILKSVYYNFYPVNIVSNYRRFVPYIRQNLINLNNSLPIENREYYNNFDLIGTPNQYGLDQANLKSFNNSSSILLNNVHSQIKSYLNSFSVIEGVFKSDFVSNNSFVYFSFKSNFEMILSFFSALDSDGNDTDFYDKNLIFNTFNNCELPIKISLLSTNDVILYNYYITSIDKVNTTNLSGRHKLSYKLNIQPISGDFSDTFSYLPFKTSTNSNKIYMIIYNPLKFTDINLMKNYHPDYLQFFIKYYSLSLYDIYESDENKINNKINFGDNTANNSNNKIIPTNIMWFKSSSELTINNSLEDKIKSSINSKSLPCFYLTYKPIYTFYSNSNYTTNKLIVNNNYTKFQFELVGNQMKDYGNFLDTSYLNTFTQVEIVTDDYKVMLPVDKLLTNKYDINNIFEQNGSIVTLYLGNISELSIGEYSIHYNCTINLHIHNNTSIQQLTVYSSNSNDLEIFTKISKNVIRINSIINDISSKFYFSLFLGNYIKPESLNYISFDAEFKNNYNETKSTYALMNNNSIFIYSTYKFINRLYVRPNIDLLVNIKLSNNNKDFNNKDVIPIVSIYSDTGEIKENILNYLQYLEDNLENTNINNDFLDINDYNHHMFTVRNYNGNGNYQEGLYTTKVEGQPLTNIYTCSRIKDDSSIISGFQPIGFNPVTTNLNLWNLDSFPIYELQIDNGKYNETTFKKYFVEKMSSINKKVYDYKKGIFNEEINKNIKRELLNITKYNNTTTFNIEFNRSIGSVSIKQFTKIFEVNRDHNDIDAKYVFYNNSFPYMYFNVPEISLPNNSVAFIAGSSSLDNIPSTEINGTRKISIPNKYRIFIRQLSPLPDASYIDSNKYLFQNYGYSKEENEYVNNEYQEYIANALNSKILKSSEYIISKINRIKQQLINSNYFGIENIVKIGQKFDILEKNINSVNQHKFNLKRSYVNNKGSNEYFNYTDNYDNLGKISNVYSNSNPFEYYSQSLINTQANGILYRNTEFQEDSDDKSGIQSAFYEGELFMRISDINDSYSKTITGRITNINNIADSNGNHSIDYDLFCEQANNFRIGDVIMGLDSGSIAVILPNDYRFNRLPNDDIITLGMGNYILNLHANEKNVILNFFLSINNSVTYDRNLVVDFINSYNFWTPEKLNTSNGFYIKLDTPPNVSRLVGIATSNLQVYIPSNFKFLEGDDTPLSSFGFVDSTINNEFNYFKDNFTNTFDTEIKWSYIINNNIDSKQYLILETKNIDEFQIEDEVFIRQHTIINNDVDYRKEIFFNTKDLISFGMYISKFETVYNKLLLENINNSYFINSISNKKIVVKNQDIEVINNSVKSAYFIDDKSSIDSNYVSAKIYNEDKSQDIGNAGFIVYTNDLGNITNLYLTNISDNNLINRDNIVISGNNVDLDLSKLNNDVNTISKISNKLPNSKIEYNNISSSQPSLVMEKIPFKNKFICSNFSQNFNEYDLEFTLKYTNIIEAFDNSKGEFFMINYKKLSNTQDNINIILGINLYTDNTTVTNLIDRYITVNGSEQYIKPQYRNQSLQLTIRNSSDISIVYVLKEIYITDNNGVLGKRVVFVKPGDDYYNEFSIINSNIYHISITSKRTFTTFSKYDDVENITDVNNIGPIDVEILVAGYEIDSIYANNVQGLISTNGSEFGTVNPNITAADTFLDNVDNISIAGLSNTNNSDTFSLNSWERYESTDYYKYNFNSSSIEIVDSNTANNSSKYYYKFDLSLNVSNLNLDPSTNSFSIVNTSTNTTKTISSGKYIVRKKYKTVKNENIEPLSIFYRLVQSYISNTYTKNLFKLLNINSKYSHNVFTSRIIKVKVCPIDNKGFSYEPNYIPLTNYNSNTVDEPVRAVPGYNKLLFPYHEFNIVKNYSSNLNGTNLDVNSKVIKRLTRVKQPLDNNTCNTRNFLPGMGFYAITEEIYPTYILGSTETGDSENIEVQLDANVVPDTQTKIINTVYRYNSNFIGYVLNTSIESSKEDSQSYRLNSDNFSKNNSDSIHSEYYVYVLLDPSITSREGIDKLFNILNNDFVHYVFDGSANKEFTTSDPLISPGVLSNGDTYSVQYNNTDKRFNLLNQSSVNKTIMSPNVYTVFNPKNIYGSLAYRNEQGRISIFDDISKNKLLEQVITNRNPDILPDDRGSITDTKKILYNFLDVLQENIMGCITVVKPVLNKSLPHYFYDIRIACATQVERPVFYKKSNNTMNDVYTNSIIDKMSYDEKLFVDGSLDLYYQEQLKNKSVLKYEPIIESTDFKDINNRNIIIEDKINLNNAINNSKECNIHNNTLKNYDSSEFKYGFDKIPSEKADGVLPEFTFEPNTDLLLINNCKKTYSYQQGPNYNIYDGSNSLTNNNEHKNVGIKKHPLKILTGRILPTINFNSIKLSINKEYDNLSKNWCLLDNEYSDELNLISSNGTFGKYKTPKYDIVGNNSNLYNANQNDDQGIYCEIKNVLELGNEYINNKTFGYIIASYNSLSLLEQQSNGKYIEEVLDEDGKTRLKILEDKLTVLSGYTQDKDNRSPFNVPHNTEVSIINEVIVYGEEVPFEIETLDENYNIITKTPQYAEKVILIRFKNKINGFHQTTQESQEQSKYYITYQCFETTKEIELLSDQEKQDLYNQYSNNDSNNKYYNLLVKNLINKYLDTDIYKATVTCKNINTLSKYNSITLADNTFTNKYIDNMENYIFDYGNKRRVEYLIDKNAPYNLNSNYPIKDTSSFLKSFLVIFKDKEGNSIIPASNILKDDIVNELYLNTDVVEIEIYISNNSSNVIPILYPKNTKVVLQKNTLISNSSINNSSSYYFDFRDKLPYNSLSSQPFIFNNEWYTRVYYRSPYNNTDRYPSSLGKQKSVINNLNDVENLSTSSNIYKKYNMFISNMKGINIPFICLEIDDNNEIIDKNTNPVVMGPIQNGTYKTDTKNAIADYNTNKIIKSYATFQGKFVRKLESLLLGNEYTWDNITNVENINLDYFVVKGIYNGFGGFCEERFDDELVSTVINNDISGRIARLKAINNKFFMFIELDTYKIPLAFTSNVNVENTNNMNQSGRSDSLNYGIFLSLLENNLTFTSKMSNVQNKLTLYGKSGMVSKKKINNPYNLNQNNYVYLVIPVFDNIELVQNNSLQGAFAKILLPGESNKTLFNTYTAASKVFNNNLYNNLTELEIAFVTNEGYLFDFNGAEHSFSLEITEIIDKFEHINPKFGNIEF